MAYLFLVLAVAAEVVGTSLLRATEGFTRLWPTLACLVAYGVAVVFLANIVRTLPVGVVYAIWSGLGTAAIVVIGATFLHQPVTPVIGVGIGLIVAGVIVLNLSGAH